MYIHTSIFEKIVRKFKVDPSKSTGFFLDIYINKHVCFILYYILNITP